jgi:murein DD-endopeptidase MepM/ murein hydrolase activator NlpD
MLDLGHGYFAVYAHLAVRQLRIKIGDNVRAGQVLDLRGIPNRCDSLGFSLNSGPPLKST